MNSVLEFMNNDHARLDGLFRESSELRGKKQSRAKTVTSIYLAVLAWLVTFVALIYRLTRSIVVVLMPEKS